VLVSGPGLRHSDQEIASLHHTYADAEVLVGKDASVQNVRRALASASVVHIAAHGTYRSDNALFSSLRLADGPLTVYDLENLRRAPSLMVLSACESGLSAVRPGDALMGLSAALLGIGCQSLIASVAPVPDAVTPNLMVELHRLLLAGRRPAEALAVAQALVATEEDGVPWSRGFVCFGAG
jgi:CHAT domain-containing protein